MNLLLQILDEGILTDSNGRNVSFRNALVIMTSNIGAKLITQDFRTPGFKETTQEKTASHELLSKKVKEELKRQFKPEFLNRIDEIIVFKRLSEEDLGSIVRLFIRKLQKRLEKQGISVTFDDSVIHMITKEGYHPSYGARYLKRVMKKHLEDLLAEEILSGNLHSEKPVKIIYKNSKIYLEKN